MSKNPKPRYNVVIDIDLVNAVKEIPATAYVESFSARVEEGLRLFLEKYKSLDVVEYSPGSDKDFELHPKKKEIHQGFSSMKKIMDEVWEERKIKTDD
ncbi:MAG TPA: hypothetical protein PKN48_01025 [Bacteroidales bacterium]|nr:hypothetical protein [Bacteroidales bacterium]